MNWFAIPTIVLGTAFFFVGAWVEKQTTGRSVNRIFLLAALMLAVPGILFSVCYLKLLGEALWFYRLRSVPGTELLASGAGLLGGLVFARVQKIARVRRFVGPWFVAMIFYFSLAAPYLKPLLLPPRWTSFEDRWSHGVCLQTSESSCGPACVATLLRLHGGTNTEEQIARESFTSRTGTENWYLARTLRRHGRSVIFARQSNVHEPWPVPSIAGVTLSSFGKSGHFIALLSRQGDIYEVGDPLIGYDMKTQGELAKSYQFTGFFLEIN